MRRWAISCALLFATIFPYSAGAATPKQGLVQPRAAAKLATLGARKLPVARIGRLSGDPCRVTAGAILKQLRDGQGETLYWPNGRKITVSAGTIGVAWHHSNGTIMTSHGWVTGITGYYWNGHALTYDVGTKGASWYHDNGQMMCKTAGVGGAKWYDRNGKVVTSCGPEWSEEEVLDQCYLRLIESSLAH